MPDIVTSENAAEFYASRLPPREEAQADEPTEGKTETKTDSTESTDSKESRVKKVAPRIAELVGERNAARTEAETKAHEAQAATAEAQALRERLEAAERQIAALATPTQREADPRPERKSFASDELYTDALTDWKVDQRIAADKRRDAEAKAAAAQAQVTKNWQSQIEAGKEDMPDFEAVVGAADTNFPHQVVLDAIVDAGPRVAYQLAKNPEEARRIAAMRPSAGIAAVLKLADQLAGDGGKTAAVAAPAPPAAKGEPFKAPEPIETLKGSASPVTKSLDDIEDFEEWKAARKAGRVT